MQMTIANVHHPGKKRKNKQTSSKSAAQQHMRKPSIIQQHMLVPVMPTLSTVLCGGGAFICTVAGGAAAGFAKPC
jgi:hypothetical protein